VVDICARLFVYFAIQCSLNNTSFLLLMLVQIYVINCNWPLLIAVSQSLVEVSVVLYQEHGPPSVEKNMSLCLQDRLLIARKLFDSAH